MSRPRIMFLNRSYWPDSEATGQLLTELCEDLADTFDVTVVAGQPNQNPERAEFRRRGVETRNGVTIRRVAHSRLPKSSLWGRAINFLAYLSAASVAAITAPRPDVVVVESDPPLLCLVGAWLQRRRGCRLVVYLQDIYPDIAVALGKIREGWLSRWLRKRFVTVYQQADCVVVLSEDMRALLVEWGVPASRVAVIPNWVDTAAIKPIKQHNPFRAHHGLNDRFVVMYSGNMGLSQRLEDVLEGAQRLRDCPEIQFVFVGNGVSKPRLQKIVQELGLSNVLFVDYQPISALSASLSAADLHLAPLDPRLTRCMMPSKLYGVLASGTPLIVIASEDSELARLVRAEQVGFVAPPRDPAALAEQIRDCAREWRAMKEMGQRARELAVRQFDRQATTYRIGQLLGDIAASPAPLHQDPARRAQTEHGAIGGGSVAESSSNFSVH